MTHLYKDLGCPIYLECISNVLFSVFWSFVIQGPNGKGGNGLPKISQFLELEVTYS